MLNHINPSCCLIIESFIDVDLTYKFRLYYYCHYCFSWHL